MPMRRLLLLLMLLPLAACGLFPSKQSAPCASSPDYKAGYQDGCQRLAARTPTSARTTLPCATISCTGQQGLS